jgi:hypothetical protein
MNWLVRNSIKDLFGVPNENSEMIVSDYQEKSKSKTFSELFKNYDGHGAINLFPSDNKGFCHRTAIFFSFSKLPKNSSLKRNQLIPLAKMLPIIIQQVLGKCLGKNKEIILITDTIDTKVFEPWLSNLKRINETCDSFEIIYVRPDGSNCSIKEVLGIF